MQVFRICNEQYANQLTSSGIANRWNKKGQFVVYTGATRSLATLELIVHRGAVTPIKNNKVMIVEIEDSPNLIENLSIENLPDNWRSISAYAQLQEIGSDWYSQSKSLVLKVPSAVIPYEFNFVINTEHPNFQKKVRLLRCEDYFWDSRLI